MKIVNGKDWNKVSCAWLGCGSHGKWAPTLVILAGREFGEHPPALMEIDVLVCTTHKKEGKALDFLSEKSQQKISTLFAEHGKAAPDWSRTTLKWRHGTASDFPKMRGN